MGLVFNDQSLGRMVLFYRRHAAYGVLGPVRRTRERACLLVLSHVGSCLAHRLLFPVPSTTGSSGSPGFSHPCEPVHGRAMAEILPAVGFQGQQERGWGEKRQRGASTCMPPPHRRKRGESMEIMGGVGSVVYTSNRVTTRATAPWHFGPRWMALARVGKTIAA